MFAVLGYHTTSAELRAALAACRRHLRPGGLLVADFWYGPAVLASPPEARERVLELEGHRWRRRAEPHHHAPSQLVEIEYRLERIDLAPGEAPGETAIELHRMRYFFPQELELLLEDSDLELVGLYGWPDLDAAPGGGGYPACLVARAP